jgi:hypothetical protein
MGHAAGAGKLVFKFPVQGSFHAHILRETFEREGCRPHFDMAERIGRLTLALFVDGLLCRKMEEARNGK